LQINGNIQAQSGVRMPENRILLVEDEVTTREILTELLRAEGYEVDSVATAGAAVTCLDSLSYGLVVADWVLPDGDGTDIADTAAQHGSKTLIITGYLSDLPAGVADRHALLSKRLGHTEILAAVRRALGTPSETA
jgi:DNA-binding response OmpR family regulator